MAFCTSVLNNNSKRPVLDRGGKEVEKHSSQECLTFSTTGNKLVISYMLTKRQTIYLADLRPDASIYLGLLINLVLNGSATECAAASGDLLPPVFKLCLLRGNK